jgi:hypothetical protein
MRDLVKELDAFFQYVWEFYNEKSGIYPIATDTQIQSAVNKFLESKPLTEFDFDSFDREEVRCILEPSYSIFLPN